MMRYYRLSSLLASFELHSLTETGKHTPFKSTWPSLTPFRRPHYVTYAGFGAVSAHELTVSWLQDRYSSTLIMSTACIWFCRPVVQPRRQARTMVDKRNKRRLPGKTGLYHQTIFPSVASHYLYLTNDSWREYFQSTPSMMERVDWFMSMYVDSVIRERCSLLTNLPSTG